LPDSQPQVLTGQKVLDQRTSPSILTFQVNPQIGSGDVTLRIRLNDHVALTQLFDTEPQRSWHDVMAAGALRATNNELVVSVPFSSGGGSVQISDIVIFFQSNIGTVVG
jgi:hypothetical protein